MPHQVHSAKVILSLREFPFRNVHTLVEQARPKRNCSSYSAKSSLCEIFRILSSSPSRKTVLERLLLHGTSGPCPCELTLRCSLGFWLSGPDVQCALHAKSAAHTGLIDPFFGPSAPAGFPVWPLSLTSTNGIDRGRVLSTTLDALRRFFRY